MEVAPINLQEREREEERVQYVIKKLKERAEDLGVDVVQKKEIVRELRKNFWSDISLNTDNWSDLLESYVDISQKSMEVAEQERRYQQSSHLLTKLKRLLDSPYFGRVDFIEEGHTDREEIYIGISTFFDEEKGDYLIYDWRAPISSLFYDYQPGPAEYLTPMGEIKGTMELKRQYMIKHGEIQGMFDTGVIIADEILQEILGKNVDVQMRSIVATIQKEQNQIIRNDEKKFVVVQGAAGSGKTSVALQRIAYLLYKHREKITSENMVLFSPNPLFKTYVSNVLPELGETNINQTTLHEYMGHQLRNQLKLEHPYDQLEELLTSEDSNNLEIRMEGILFKGTLDFYQILESYGEFLEQKGMIFRGIRFRGRTLISAEEMEEQFYHFDPSIRLSNRVELLKKWLLQRLHTIEAEEMAEDWVRNEIELLDEMEYLKAYQELQNLEKSRSKKGRKFEELPSEEEILCKRIVKRNFRPLKRGVKQLRFINLLALYKQLFAKPKLFHHVAKEILLPNRLDEICRETLSRLRKNELSYEDTAPFLLLKEMVEGAQTYSQVRYVLIDEAQDYSPFQLRLLSKMFPRSRWTILGDLHQAIWFHNSSLSIENPFFGELFHEETEVYHLSRSYRSTREIVEFTKEILKNGERIEAFNRRGELPQVISVADQESLHQKIYKDLLDLQAKGMNTIAIICKTAQESEQVYRQFSQNEEFRSKWEFQLITKEVSSYEEGLLILPAYLAKGLEFDAVLLYNASSERYFRERERNLFYTACTRALHYLHLYYVGEVSPFISDFEIEKYKSEGYIHSSIKGGME